MRSSRLFVDGQLVIDNGYEKQQTYGGTFYGAGTIEEKGVCNVTAGEKYHIEIEFTNFKNPGKTAEVAIKRGQPSLMTAALRLGGTMKIQDEERALQDAVDLVRSCDAAICFTGSDLGWEGEGADRTQFLLPGRTNELVERLLAVKPETVICNQTVRIRFARFIINTRAEFLGFFFSPLHPAVSTGFSLCNALDQRGDDSTAILVRRQRDGKCHRRRRFRQGQPERPYAVVFPLSDRGLYGILELAGREWQGLLWRRWVSGMQTKFTRYQADERHLARPVRRIPRIRGYETGHHVRIWRRAILHVVW